MFQQRFETEKPESHQVLPLLFRELVVRMQNIQATQDSMEAKYKLFSSAEDPNSEKHTSSRTASKRSASFLAELERQRELEMQHEEYENVNLTQPWPTTAATARISSQTSLKTLVKKPPMLPTAASKLYKMTAKSDWYSVGSVSFQHCLRW